MAINYGRFATQLASNKKRYETPRPMYEKPKIYTEPRQPLFEGTRTFTEPRQRLSEGTFGANNYAEPRQPLFEKSIQADEYAKAATRKANELAQLQVNDSKRTMQNHTADTAPLDEQFGESPETQRTTQKGVRELPYLQAFTEILAAQKRKKRF